MGVHSEEHITERTVFFGKPLVVDRWYERYLPTRQFAYGLLTGIVAALITATPLLIRVQTLAADNKVSHANIVELARTSAWKANAIATLNTQHVTDAQQIDGEAKNIAELQNQINDLRGQISTLKQQTSYTITPRVYQTPVSIDPTPPKQAPLSPTPTPAPQGNPAQQSPQTGWTRNWDAIAQCESGGNWNINTGNGFLGGLQFTEQTWRAYGGVGAPQNASPNEQKSIAERVLRGQGIGAWPVCGKRG